MGLFDGWFGSLREKPKHKDFRPGQKVRVKVGEGVDWEVVNIDGDEVLVQPINEQGETVPFKITKQELSELNEETGFEIVEEKDNEKKENTTGIQYEKGDRVKRFLDSDTLEDGWIVLGKRPGGKVLVAKMKDGQMDPTITAVVSPDDLEPDEAESSALVKEEKSSTDKDSAENKNDIPSEALVHVGPQEMVKFSPKENVKKVPRKTGKLKVVFADTSALAEDRAHDLAERFLEETAQEAQQGFWRSLPRRIWKGGLFREVYRQREISRVRREITEGENLYAGENQDRTQHREAMSGIVRRFISEYEDTIHRDLGEARERFVDENIEDENLRTQLSSVKAQIRELVLAYARGEIADETFPAERTRVLSQIKKLSPSVIVDGQMYADNLGEIARQVRLSIEHGEGLEALDLDFEIIVGRAKGGVRTEAKYNTFDKIIKKLQKVPVLKYVADEAWAGTVAAVAYSALRVPARAVLSSRLAAWGSFGATTAFAGIMGGMRKSRLLKEDRSAHAREMAQGDSIAPGSSKREQFEQYRLETRGAGELVDNLESILYSWNPDGSRAIRELNQEEINHALVALAEIEARVRVSDGPNGGDKVDLISYSRYDRVEQEHARLDIARAEAKVNLRRLLGGEIAPGTARYPGEGDVYTRPELEDLFHSSEYREAGEEEQVRRIESFLLARKLERGITFETSEARSEFNASNRSQAQMVWRRSRGGNEERSGADERPVVDLDARLNALISAREQDILGEKTEKDRIFNKMRRSEALKAGVLTAVVAGTIGTGIQETRAFFDNNTQGLVETGVEKLGLKAHHIGNEVTALEDLRHWIGGDVPDAPGPLHELIVGANSHLSLPEGMTATPNPDGSFSLDWGSGHVDGLHLGHDGLLDSDSIAKLHGAGLTPTGLVEHITHQTAGSVTPEQYIQDHPAGFGHVSRDLWFDNDTPKPVFDHNELKLWWGGADNSGMQGKNFIFNIEQMTQSGSYHNGLSPDAVSLIKDGKMALLLSVSEGTQTHPFVVPFDTNGNAIIDPGSPAYQLFQNAGGHAEFLGKFAEVAQITGTVDGTDHVQIFATHVGAGMDHLMGITETVDDVPRMIIDGPHDYVFYPPPVVPIFKNIPLEKTKRPQKPETQKPGIVKHEKAREMINKELDPIVQAVKKIDWDRYKELDPEKIHKIGGVEHTEKDKIKQDIEVALNQAIDKLPSGINGAYNLDVRNLLKTFGIKFAPVDEQGHIKITSMIGLEQALWGTKFKKKSETVEHEKIEDVAEKEEAQSPEMLDMVRSQIENAIRQQEAERGWVEMRIGVSTLPKNIRGEKGEDAIKQYTRVANDLGYSARYFYSEDNGGAWVLILSKIERKKESKKEQSKEGERKIVKEKVEPEKENGGEVAESTPPESSVREPAPVLAEEEKDLVAKYWATMDSDKERADVEAKMREWIKGAHDGQIVLVPHVSGEYTKQKLTAFKDLAGRMGYEIGDFKMRRGRFSASIRKIDGEQKEPDEVLTKEKEEPKTESSPVSKNEKYSPEVLAEEFWKNMDDDTRERARKTIDAETDRAIKKGRFEILTGGKGKPKPEDSRRISAYLMNLREKGYDFDGKPRFSADGRMGVPIKKIDDEEVFDIREILKFRNRKNERDDTIGNSVKEKEPRERNGLEKMLLGTVSREIIKKQSKKFWDRQEKKGSNVQIIRSDMLGLFDEAVKEGYVDTDNNFELRLNFANTPIENVEEAIGAWRELGLRNGLTIKSFNVLPTGNDVSARFTYDRNIDMELQEARQADVIQEGRKYRDYGEVRIPESFRQRLRANDRNLFGKRDSNINPDRPKKDKRPIAQINEPFPGQTLEQLDRGANEKKWIEKMEEQEPGIKKSLSRAKSNEKRIREKLENESSEEGKEKFLRRLEEVRKRLYDGYSALSLYYNKIGEKEIAGYFEKRKLDYEKLDEEGGTTSADTI